MMTQVLGGYLSDRIGGEVVLPVAALVYSTIIFLTPQLGYLSPDKQLTLYMFVGLRVILGLAQGKYNYIKNYHCSSTMPIYLNILLFHKLQELL